MKVEVKMIRVHVALEVLQIHIKSQTDRLFRVYSDDMSGARVSSPPGSSDSVRSRHCVHVDRGSLGELYRGTRSVVEAFRYIIIYIVCQVDAT